VKLTVFLVDERWLERESAEASQQQVLSALALFSREIDNSQWRLVLKHPRLGSI